MTSSKGSLLLLPNLLGNRLKPAEQYFPVSVYEAVSGIDGLIAESETEGRRYLGHFKTKKPARQIPIAILPKKSLPEDHEFLLEPLMKGETWGVVSDAGLPSLADPGALLVLAAKKRGIPVEAFVGPSSLVLALLQTGLPAQKFSFQGYLPKEENRLQEVLRTLEKRSASERETEIFIETPYRNARTWEMLVNTLAPDTWLGVAVDLTLPEEQVEVFQVKTWRRKPPLSLEKRNAVFLFYASGLLF